MPDGQDFVCINGSNRYTRALYGGPTAWRLETSDRPIFATYRKGACRNISLALQTPTSSIPLEETAHCEARYRANQRSYALTDSRIGSEASIAIVAVASMEREAAIWQITVKGLPTGCTLLATSAEIKQAKLFRSGDMGVDPQDAFDPAPNKQPLQQLAIDLPSDTILYICSENELLTLTNGEAFNSCIEASNELAAGVRIVTPDPFLNPIGGALAAAANGIWGEEGVWLHGAVGWRMPLSGWRAAYVGDALGWHNRARQHFDNYAASQVVSVPCTIPHPEQDSTMALARSAKQWGTPQYSNGYICRNPQRNDQMHHYDMNLCYIDELLWHLRWTGDTAYAQHIWPTIERHLKWEKLNYDPDNDGLYDAYACIWASDALYYNSGAVTHSSAYNYRANSLAADIAELLGYDPQPYRQEAAKTLAAINQRLWLPQGHWAEYQDAMGHKRQHTAAAVWTIYHAIDSDIATPQQAYMATDYITHQIPHIPITIGDSKGHDSLAADINNGHYATISTTNWMPYSWSINNVAGAEVMHTALAYFQAERREEGFHLMKSQLLDGMYLGNSPANFGQISHYDAARGECYRDFGDPIGITSRTLIQGLYGLLPDALHGQLLIKPGFPAAWHFASLHTADIDFCFTTPSKENENENSYAENNGSDTEGYGSDVALNSITSSYSLCHRLPAVHSVELQVPMRRTSISSATINGQPAEWRIIDNGVTAPLLALTIEAEANDTTAVLITWSGKGAEVSGGECAVAQGCEPRAQGMAVATESEGMTSDGVRAARASVVIGEVDSMRCRMVDISQACNANVSDIFRNEYLSPRSPYTTLQLPIQGISEWCHPLATADIDDSGLRAAVINNQLDTALGIPLRSPATGQNIAFTSLWDNYPDSLAIPLTGKASKAYLLLAGSTNHMQCHIDNGIVRVYYTDGSCDSLPLRNPDNWPPIEQLLLEDGLAFNRQAAPQQRLCLKTAVLSDSLASQLPHTGINCNIDGGAAILLTMPLNKQKRLKQLVLETLSNDVVIGLMAVTLQR